MPEPHDLVRAYARQHTDPTNRRLHAVGVPTIVFAIVLAAVSIPNLLGTPLVLGLLLVTASYVHRDRLVSSYIASFLAIAGTAATALTLVVGPAVVQITAAVFFVAGWALQIVGHLFEGSSPALLRDVRHARIAPLFVTAELLSAAGIETRTGRALKRSRSG